MFIYIRKENRTLAYLSNVYAKFTELKIQNYSNHRFCFHGYSTTEIVMIIDTRKKSQLSILM